MLIVMAFITVRDAEGCFPRVLQGHFGLVCHVLPSGISFLRYTYYGVIGRVAMTEMLIAFVYNDGRPAVAEAHKQARSRQQASSTNAAATQQHTEQHKYQKAE